MSARRLEAVNFVYSLQLDPFHESVRAGDIASLRQRLKQEPLLSQAPAGERATLLLAVLHPDAHKAVEMLELLMENGAALGFRFLREWNVLLYACYHGVEWAVVECLTKWNALQGGGALQWSDCEENGNSSLLLACLGGHTQLCLRILDELDMTEYSTENHPFAVLQQAIEVANEAHALAIAEHPKIQAAVQAKYKDVRHSDYSLLNCVGCAVKQEMASVLRLLDSLNHPTVYKMTWLATFKYSEEQEKLLPKTENPVILGVASQFAKDRRWEKAKWLVLLRRRGQDFEPEDGQLRVDLLARLPDHLFRLVVEFIKPSMSRKADANRVAIEFLVETM
jgi:hypothetical protein